MSADIYCKHGLNFPIACNLCADEESPAAPVASESPYTHNRLSDDSCSINCDGCRWEEGHAAGRADLLDAIREEARARRDGRSQFHGGLHTGRSYEDMMTFAAWLDAKTGGRAR